MNTSLRTVLALATTAALTIAFAPAGPSGPGDATTTSDALAPEGSEVTHVTFPSRDGTMLQGDLLLPADGCPDEGCTPVVSVGPYFGTSTQGFPVVNPVAGVGPSDRFDDFIAYEFDFGNGDVGTIFDRGYAFLMVDSRGFGESGGCNDYGGPGEQSDAYAAVEWAGTQDWSTGKVGMWGKSYDAWTQVMALAENPPHLEAVVIQAPIIDGYGIAWDDGVHHDSGWYATTALYQGYDQAPPTAQYAAEHPEQFLLATAGTADTCWAEQHVHPVAGHDRTLEYWRQRDLRPSASRNDDVAVLWSHGWNDLNTKSDQIFGAYTLSERADAATANRRAWFGHWAHDRGNEVAKVGRGGFLEEALDWFDGHLRDQPFRYGVNEHNVVEVHDQHGDWRTEASYPPADVVMTTLELNTGSYSDLMGGTASDGYWTIGEPVTEDLRIAGEPEVEVTADFVIPGAQFIGVLYDVDPERERATEISRFPMRLDAAGTAQRSVGTPSDYVLEPGHQLAFQVRSDHQESTPYPTAQDVTVTALSVDVPFLTYERVSNLPGVRSQAGPFTMDVGGVDLTPNATFTYPETLVPLPPLRRELQPEVTTGDLHAPVVIPGLE
jgi:uncharacterized protein